MSYWHVRTITDESGTKWHMVCDKDGNCATDMGGTPRVILRKEDAEAIRDERNRAMLEAGK